MIFIIACKFKKKTGINKEVLEKQNIFAAKYIFCLRFTALTNDFVIQRFGSTEFLSDKIISFRSFQIPLIYYSKFVCSEFLELLAF